MNIHSYSEIFDFWRPNLAPENFQETITFNDVIVTTEGVWKGNELLWDSRHYFQGFPLDRNLFTGEKYELAPPKEANRKIATTHYIDYYCGWHYGHFITETLSRCHKLLSARVDKPVTINLSNHQYPTHLYDSLNMPEATYFNHWKWPLFVKFPLILKEPLEVEELEIATSTFDLGLQVYQEYFDTTQAYGRKMYRDGQVCAEKLFLSRSKFNNSFRKTHNEVILDEMMRSDGWLVVHPEDYSIGEQIWMLENSVIVCAAEGSALHTLSLCNPEHLPAELIVLTQEINETNISLALQNYALGIHSTYINCMTKKNLFLDTDKHFGNYYDLQIPDPNAILDAIVELT